MHCADKGAKPVTFAQFAAFEVPVVVTEADDLKSLEFAIVENVQRHDLNPLEEAQGYKRLIDDFA